MSVVAELSTLVMMWKKHAAVDEWINKVWSFDAAVYYLTRKQNKVLLQHG